MRFSTGINRAVEEEQDIVMRHERNSLGIGWLSLNYKQTNYRILAKLSIYQYFNFNPPKCRIIPKPRFDYDAQSMRLEISLHPSLSHYFPTDSQMLHWVETILESKQLILGLNTVFPALKAFTNLDHIAKIPVQGTDMFLNAYQEETITISKKKLNLFKFILKNS